MRSEEEIKSTWLNPENIVVSITCIAYNHEPFIEQSIQGFLIQETNFAFELIIHDDASTDNTQEIIRNYQKLYPNLIRTILQTENHWMGKGINATTAIVWPSAKGKYIAWCEGDDYWTDPQKLQKQVDFLEKNREVGLVYTDIDTYHISNNNWCRSIFNSKIAHRSSTFEEHLEKRGYLAPLTWVFRNSLLESFNSASHDSVDSSFEFMLIAFQITKIHYLDVVTGVRNVLQNSASNHTDDGSKYKYRKGLFKIQRLYLNKYSNDKELKGRIYFANYLQLITDAKKFADEELFTEAKIYLLKKVPTNTKKERLKHIRLTIELQKKNAKETFDIGEKGISSFLQSAILKVDPFSKFNLWFWLYKLKKSII